MFEATVFICFNSQKTKGLLFSLLCFLLCSAAGGGVVTFTKMGTFPLLDFSKSNNGNLLIFVINKILINYFCTK